MNSIKQNTKIKVFIPLNLRALRALGGKKQKTLTFFGLNREERTQGAQKTKIKVFIPLNLRALRALGGKKQKNLRALPGKSNVPVQWFFSSLLKDRIGNVLQAGRKDDR